MWFYILGITVFGWFYYKNENVQNFTNNSIITIVSKSVTLFHDFKNSRYVQNYLATKKIIRIPSINKEVILVNIFNKLVLKETFDNNYIEKIKKCISLKYIMFYTDTEDLTSIILNYIVPDNYINDNLLITDILILEDIPENTVVFAVDKKGDTNQLCFVAKVKDLYSITN